MPMCIELMAQALKALSNGLISLPPRLITPLIDASASFALMPGSALEPRIYGAKIIGVHPSNPAQGLPAHQGFVALFDHDTGRPLAIVEGAQITAIRTAAASALATRVLARADCLTHGVFGAGVQAAAHIEAIACVRPIERVLIWARTFSKACDLADSLRHLNCEVRATADPSEAAACEIISTTTASREPVLRGQWLRPGCHVNLVGAHSPHSREADDDAIRGSSVYVDSRQSALSEAGDVLIPLHRGLISIDHIVAELGEVLTGEKPARLDDAEITVFKSLGLFAQDLVAAAHVYEQACQQQLGSVLPFQD